MKAKIQLQALSVALVLSVLSFPASANDIGNLPDVLMANLGVIAQIMQTLSIFIGLGLFIGGMFQLKRYGEMRTMMSSQMSISGPMMTIIAGVAMLFSPVMISTLLVSFWGSGGVTDLNPGNTNSGWGQYMQPVLMLVRIIGIYAFMRGFVIAAKSGSHSGQPTVGKALVHILAGIMCVHVVGTMKLIQSILGFDFAI